jgi:hypothetical protein
VPIVPRIIRANPSGRTTRPAQGIPVIARIRWLNGDVTEARALATAWTRDAVEITWHVPGAGQRADWIPAQDVRRPGAWTPPGAGGWPGENEREVEPIPDWPGEITDVDEGLDDRGLDDKGLDDKGLDDEGQR